MTVYVPNAAAADPAAAVIALGSGIVGEVLDDGTVLVHFEGDLYSGGGLDRANADWWRLKLARTRVRDDDTTAQLEAAGWRVVRIWEHEEPTAAADRTPR
jgi:hypothetical protein